MLNNTCKLAKTEYKDISIAPDLTKKQREEDNKLGKEAEKKNEELEGEEEENWEFKQWA